MPNDPWRAELEASLAEDHPWLRGLARRLVNDEAGADDLVQEAWARALVARPQQVGGARAWFATVMRNLARDQHVTSQRRAAREESTARGERVVATSEIVAGVEIQRRLLEAVMSLEEPNREALILRYYGELTPREIASGQGAPLATVKSRIARGLAELRERLDSSSSRREWLGGLAVLAEAGAPRAFELSLAAKLAVIALLGISSAWGIHALRRSGGAEALDTKAEMAQAAAPSSNREPLQVEDSFQASGDEAGNEESQSAVESEAGEVALPPRKPNGSPTLALPDSPPGLVLIRGGETQIGTSLATMKTLLADNPQLQKNSGGFLAEVPRHTVTVDDYFVMLTEVTNEQYHAYVRDAGVRPPIAWGGASIDEARGSFLVSEGERRLALEAAGENPGARNTFDEHAWWEQNWKSAAWTMPAASALDPVVYVDFHDARAYAEWAGLRLPSEYEYERAVRGDTDRLFPWGNVFDPGIHAATVEQRGVSEPMVVGTFPLGANPEGVMDLAGNVWEWTSSKYVAYPRWKHKSFTIGEGKRKKVIDSPPPFAPQRRVVRGGSMQNSQFFARGTTRGGFDRNQEASALGLRCVSSAIPGLDLAQAHLRNLEGDLTYAPRESVVLQRWRTAASECTVVGYEVISAHDFVLFTPVETTGVTGLAQLERAEEPIPVGLLALSLDCVEPELDAGTYLVALRAAESAGAPASFVLLDLGGEVVTSLPAEGLSHGSQMPSRVGVSEGRTLVFELFLDDERGLSFSAQLALEFPSATFGSDWR